MKNKDLNKTLSKLEWCYKDNEKGTYDGVEYVFSPSEVNQLYNYVKLLERENKALSRDNETKCEVVDELRRKVLGLEQTVKRQQKQLDRYYRAVMKQ